MSIYTQYLILSVENYSFIDTCGKYLKICSYFRHLDMNKMKSCQMWSQIPAEEYSKLMPLWMWLWSTMLCGQSRFIGLTFADYFLEKGQMACMLLWRDNRVFFYSSILSAVYNQRWGIIADGRKSWIMIGAGVGF